ncbi:MAG: LicD family protein [Bacteroidales bacterium]|nr:LicD family protein [Bacteroidales bacterium]
MENLSQYNAEGTTLRKMQLRMLDILVEIDKICRKHDIKYWIDSGTLLGAVRHGGFIPWDDDIDIAMPSEDLTRFKEIAPKELPENLFFQSRETDPGYRSSFCKVRDRNSFFITKHEDFTRNYQKGLFVDIFEVVPFPNVNKRTLKFIMRWYKKIFFFYSVKNDVSLKNHLAAIAFPIFKAGLNLVWGILNLKKKDRIGFEKHFNSGFSFSKDTVLPMKDIIFEGKTFYGPANPDQYLSELYGNYMQIPPEEQRRTHIIFVEFI